MGLTKKLLDEECYKDSQYDLEYDEYLYYLLKRSKKRKEKKTLPARIKTLIQFKIRGFKNLRTFWYGHNRKKRISTKNRNIKFTSSKKRNLL
jgi:hypothetical protein